MMTGNAESLGMLCHSKSNYLREVHIAQFESKVDVVVRAFPICSWASSSVAIVTGIVAVDSPDYFGTQDLLSIWMKEAGDWKLLSMTNDPTNTASEEIAQFGDWAVTHLAPFQTESDVVEENHVASKAEKHKPKGERFDQWQWKPADISEPFVQVAEFHYGQSSRLFLKGPDVSECYVSEGSLWSTGSTWTLRVWTLSKGMITIGEEVDFQN